MKRLWLVFILSIAPASFCEGVWAQSFYTATWGYYYDRPLADLSDLSIWRQVYRDHARVRLGPERRLVNGISWRLLTDVETGIAWPRITWMPDKNRLQVANEMLEGGHGASIEDARAQKQELDGINRSRRASGRPLIDFVHATTQTAVGLPYASTRLLSVIDMESELAEGSIQGRFIRGLTFDLEQRKVYRIESCPGRAAAYGKPVAGEGLDYKFRFAGLLDVCSEEAYVAFRRLLLHHAELAARKARPERDEQVDACLHHYIKHRPDEYLSHREDLKDSEDLVLYLTFGGLAVHFTLFYPEHDIECTLYRTPLNPIIIPYRELAPFMKPGPWRDELLALR